MTQANLEKIRTLRQQIIAETNKALPVKEEARTLFFVYKKNECRVCHTDISSIRCIGFSAACRIFSLRTISGERFFMVR